jgi:hemolysin III
MSIHPAATAGAAPASMQGNDMSNAVLRTRRTHAPRRRHDAGTNVPGVPPKSRALALEIVPLREETPTAVSPPPAWYRSDAYELWNALTHGAGLILSIVGALVMGATVFTTGDPWRIVGSGVFVAAMMAVYAASTLSHAGFAARWRTFLRKVDQGTIYLLVVGTYTPFGLAYLRSGAGWSLLAILWIGAILGFVSKVLFAHRLESGLIWTYITLGVIPVITIPWLWNVIPAGTGPWMFLGGAFYLVGTYFLVNDTCKRPFHAIWHLLVMAGSTCHFVAILAIVGQAVR